MSSTDPNQIDEDFTDIELADLPNLDAAPDPASEVALASHDDEESDGGLEEAHEAAARLRAHAEGLSELDGADLAEHVDYYQRTHATLQHALSDIDHA